ncbi:pyridoxal phosphate (PLP)-dependent transferases superfamily protein [Actinidia rufa]|uniref:Pyridoxal phosphate (PLP)-dependent transferases superfamily protein n=1 Tax=Actinidia rufa TaxID=165716 RepID=A0A7J0G457_9ERIC|nr:pyridoxal phosphate (PLP)-dependent transferases superfamily protein [Actinidia rufa]
MGSLDSNFSVNSTEFKPLDPEEFRKQAHTMVDFIADYYKNIETYPVLSQAQPGYLRARLPETAPYRPETFETILQDVEKSIIPGITHWLSPNFLNLSCFKALVVGSYKAQLVTRSSAPSSPRETVHSRTWALIISGKLVVYGSDQTHSTYTKACKLAGIYPRNIRSVPAGSDTCFAMSPVALRKVIDADVAAGLVPLYLCVTVGTTSTTAVDPLEDLADVANDYGVWVHVDAAYGGSACICPEFRHYLDGIELVDSLSLSPHKWLLSYLDCCCLWVKKPGLLVKALSTNPEYLRNKPSESDSVVDYKDWQVGTGRRFKALRLWLVLRSYGIANLQSHIRSDVRMAKMFEGFVKSDSRFELVVPRIFSLVCFRLNPHPGSYPGYLDLLNKKLLEWVNSTGGLYMTHTVAGWTLHAEVCGGGYTHRRVSRSRRLEVN